MKSLIRRVDHWSIERIRAQWDGVALLRHEQLRSGRDVSFESILKPTILQLIGSADCTSTLDAGCGSGVLSEVLSEKSLAVTGVDMSAANIAIALNSASRPKNVLYVSDTIEGFSASTTERYSLIVANMVLQDSSDLHGCLDALASVCCSQGVLVATITHPWFWPTYWGYDKQDWFRYSDEQAIEAPFKISTDTTPIGMTTHFHRPLSLYLKQLSAVGFVLETMLEPMPQRVIQDQYPAIWQFPRFLAFRCRRHE